MCSDLVSVIIPVYNRAGLIARTLDSVLTQTYRKIQIVVVDDGSIDSTPDVLREYVRRHPDKIVVVTQQNMGQVHARNNALARATGKYIAFLDSDDTWVPDKLRKQLPLFRPGVGLVYSAIREVDDKGDVIRTVACDPAVRGKTHHLLLVRNRMTGGTVVVTRKALDRVGFFDTTLKAGENWDLWIRISKAFLVEFVNEPLLNYMVHSNNMSKDQDRMIKCTSDILKKHFPKRPDTPELQQAYRLAYANYYYGCGVINFTAANYGQAGRYFLKSWEFVPNYRDTTARLARCLLGKNMNQLLSVLKRGLLKYRSLGQG